MTYRQFWLSNINGAVNSAKSLDLVADMHQIHSIKCPTENRRGKCTGIKVTADYILPRRNKYLTNDDFKVDFNSFLRQLVTILTQA